MLCCCYVMENVLSVTYMQERGHSFHSVARGTGRLFVQRFSISYRGRYFKQHPRHLHADWGTKRTQHASHLPPNLSTEAMGQHASQKFPRPLQHWLLSKPPWYMWFCTTIEANWIFREYCRRLKCTSFFWLWAFSGLFKVRRWSV